MAKEEEQPNKLRWGDLSDDGGYDADDEYLKRLLPPTRVIGPDEDGIKKVVEYKFREDGSTVKVTTTTRHRKLADTRRSKRAAERRSWAKFGAAVHDDVHGSVTTVSTEEIFFERPTAPGIYILDYFCFSYAINLNCRFIISAFIN